MRDLKGFHLYFVSIISFFASIFHLYTASFGVLTPRIQRGFHLLFLLPIAFLWYPANAKSPKDRPSLWDYILFFIISSPIIYVILQNTRLQQRWELSSKVFNTDLIFGFIIVVLIIELVRRAVTPILAYIITGSLVYLTLGHCLPSFLGHRVISLDRCIEISYLLSDEGIFGSLVGTSSTYVAIFVLFGSFLLGTGITEYFTNFALAIAGGSRGGPAKLAVLSSALFGTVTGVGVANVFATGSFTIPLMKSRGYRPEFAAGVEAAASTGGQYLPPVMGAAAFLMAQMLSISYIQVCIHASLSAVLYYFSLFYVVDLESIKYGLKGEKKEDLPVLSEILKKVYLFSPIILMLFLLIIGYSPQFAATRCILLSIIISTVNPKIREQYFKIFTNCMVEGAKNTIMVATALSGISIIVAVIIHTGLGLKFSSLITFLSGGQLIIALILIAIGVLLLGAGVPSTAAYVLSVLLGGRALINMGVVPIAAHLFCFYFAIIASITPPVALCSYAAASIANCDPLKAGIEGLKLGLVGFIIPFYFVFNPELLSIGRFHEILYRTILAVIVIILTGSAVQGYFKDNYLNCLGRIILLVIIVLLIQGHYVSVLISSTLLLLFILCRLRLFSKDFI